MAVPCLIIGGVDYAERCLELKPSGNGLNADGSGRDVQTGEMVRVKIADKLNWEVKMDDLDESQMRTLALALKETFYQATMLNPETGVLEEKTYYTDTRPFGAQVYRPGERKTYYTGVSFTMTQQ